jgi:hypothetical protein
MHAQSWDIDGTGPNIGADRPALQVVRRWQRHRHHLLMQRLHQVHELIAEMTTAIIAHNRNDVRMATGHAQMRAG